MPTTNLKSRILYPLEFESKVLGKEIYKFSIENYNHLPDLKTELSKLNRCYVVTQVESSQSQIINELLRLGFKLMGFPLFLENKIIPSVDSIPSDKIRFADLNDLDQLLEITKGSFFNVHWYKEHEVFDKSKIDEIYLQWVRNSLSGRADKILVFEEANKIQGYLAANYYPTEKLAKIDLLCVSENKRGLGIGKELVRAFVSHYSKTCSLLQVKTEGDNYPALKAYNSCGFYSKTLSVNLNLLIS